MNTLNNIAELLGNVPGMVFRGIIDPPFFSVVIASDGCAELTGYAPPEFTCDNGVRFFDLVHDDDKDFYRKIFESTIAQAIPLETTLKITTKGGEEKQVWLKCRIVDTDEVGMPYVLEGIALDISKLLRIEVAKHANRDKTAFFSRMSSEVRTSLNAILGMVEICLMDGNEEKIRDQAAGIKTAGNKLMAVMSGVMDFARLENNDIEIYHEEYSLAGFLTDIVVTLRPMVDEAGLRFNISIDETLPNFLTGDMGRLKQVVYELVTNAIKFTDIGYISLAVEGYEENGIVNLSIHVEDTGRGIKDEDREDIFTEFMQFDIKSIEGLGLGLTVARRLVRLMGGKLEGSSMHGLGSIFTISLPQQASRTNISKVRANIDLDNLERRQDKKGTINFVAPDACVLVVDDISANLEVAKGLMRPYNMHIMVCTSGEEAIEAVKDQDFDLIFMDIMIPVMDGVETVSLIRGLGIAKTDVRNVPIVALTADERFSSKELVQESGFDDFLPKPIETSRLHSIIAKWIPGNKQESISAPVVSDPSDTVIDFEIANVNIERGIQLTGGSLELYFNVLNAFYGNGRNIIDNLGEYLKNGNYKLYGVHAHALKSSSASIGAEGFSKFASSMESAALQEKHEFVKANHAMFLKELDGLLNAINAVLEPTSEHPQDNVSVQANKKKTALIIDDTDLFIMILEDILEGSFETLVSISGEDGLETARQHQPDVIFLDVIMPGLSGIEVLKELKADEKLKSIPVILVSGMEGDVSMEEGYALGAVAYIRKPFERSDVIRTIADIMGP